MRERPILFSAPMVRALLSGAKTQTRRVVKHPANIDSLEASPNYPGEWVPWVDGDPGESIFCPYGVPGDRLWVREAFAFISDCRHDDPGTAALAAGAFYRADEISDCGDIRRWRPSIHMPRWASRITLEITGVRVERLAAISEADAEAEGIREPSLGDLHVIDHGQPGSVARADAPPLVLWEFLWKHVNGDASWDANPWVWVLEFKRIEAAHG